MADNPSGPSVAHHFGPDPATVGGMATVIRVLTEHNVGGEIVDSHPTWRPESPLTTVRMALDSGGSASRRARCQRRRLDRHVESAAVTPRRSAVGRQGRSRGPRPPSSCTSETLAARYWCVCSSRLRTLPVALRGSSARNTTSRGTL
jgi:hypothetical protein